MDIIKELKTTPVLKMDKPEFKFEFSAAVASSNWTTLIKYDLHLGKALNAQRNSQLGFGSEFRHHSILEKLFQNHPLWSRV